MESTCSTAMESTSEDSSDEHSSPAPEELRNWLELPRDVISLIFIKLGAVDILLSAQSVCSLWRNLAKQPHLFRCIDMRSRWDLFDDEYDMEKIAREAVDRSCGQLDEFSMEQFGSNHLLEYVAERSRMMKCFRLISCYHITDEVMIEAVKKFSLLEEFHLCHCPFSKEVIEAVGSFCPRLKCFRLNERGERMPHVECDEEAFAIAESMPAVRHLHLFGNKLTDEGLRAILDGCPHLESLDLRRCFSLQFEGDLQKRCTDRIRKLRLPEDSTDDYEFEAGFTGYGSSDEGYPSGFSEIDFLSDDEYYEFSDGMSDGSYLSDYEEYAF